MTNRAVPSPSTPVSTNTVSSSPPTTEPNIRSPATTNPIIETITNLPTTIESQPDPNKPILTLTRDITLRQVTHNDAKTISDQANSKTIARNMSNRWPHPYTLDDAHDWIAQCRDKSKWRSTGPPAALQASLLDDPVSPPNSTHEPKQQNDILLPTSWAITQSDAVIGMIGLMFQSDIEVRTAEIGYWLGQSHWGQGIATEVLRSFLGWVWRTYPWIVRIQAKVYSWNPASGSVLQKCGFVMEGVLRNAVWRLGEAGDVWVYGLLRDEVVG